MKLICIGRNYAAHIEELENNKPDEPVIFMKPDSAILPKKHPLFLPEFSSEVHHEVEVLIKINKVGKHIGRRFANKYYDEVSLGIDFTARDLQARLKKQGLPWEKAKGFDGSAMIGKWLPVREMGDLNEMAFHLKKNGEIVQQGNTNRMLWKIDELIAYVSTFFTLKKGDIIFTGTPAGVGSVKRNDYLEGFLKDKKMFSLTIK